MSLFPFAADSKPSAPASLNLPLFPPPLPDLPFTLSFHEDSIVLDSVAAVALPSNPSIDDLFSRNSSTGLGSSARSLVPDDYATIFGCFANGVPPFPLKDPKMTKIEVSDV